MQKGLICLTGLIQFRINMGCVRYVFYSFKYSFHNNLGFTKGLIDQIDLSTPYQLLSNTL